MNIKTKFLLPILAVATACGGSGSSTEPQPDQGITPAAKLLPTNEEILAKVYDSEYSVPSDFFVDERASMTRSYTLHHVLDQSDSYEMCTNDLVTAQAWEQADNDSRAVNGYYVDSYENDRYFEFARELSFNDDVSNIGDITSPGFARVFKCSHTNRDGVDRQLLDGYAGRLEPAVLDAQSLREFTEYLWQFRFFQVSDKKILDSSSEASADGLQHALLLALVTNQGTGRCDLIELVEWRFTANVSTGDVQRTFDTVRSFEASFVDGEPSLCGG
jgi:hypothetical protein